MHGVFVAGKDWQIQFAQAPELTPNDFAAAPQQVRRRGLRSLARAGYLDSADARDIARCDHSGGV